MKLYSGACERNKLPIAEALSAIFRTPGLVLEVASGTGMHAEYFARQLPHLQWQPSDVDEQALSSIQAWRAESGANNLRPPIVLDVAHGALTLDLSDEQVVGMFNANMVHISPWSATLGLFRCAGQLLTSGGQLVMYGPYRIDGQMSESNRLFDESLQSRDPRWGVRALEDLVKEAEGNGLSLQTVQALPANNHLLVFARD